MSSAIIGQNFPRLLKIATEYPVGFFLPSIFQTTYKIDKGKDIYKSREKKKLFECNVKTCPADSSRILMWLLIPCSGSQIRSASPVRSSNLFFSSMDKLCSTSPAVTFTVHLHLLQPWEIPLFLHPGVKMMNCPSSFTSHSWRLLIQN